VRRKKWLSILGEEVFVGLNHAFEPRKELFGAVIRMENDRDAIVLGYRSCVHGKSDRSCNVCVGHLRRKRRSDGYEYKGFEVAEQRSRRKIMGTLA